MAHNQYAYADQVNRRIVIAEAELNLTGTYSGSTSYVSRDVVVFGASKYIALGPVSGLAPAGNHSDYWSILALIGEDANDPFAPIYAELADINAIAVSGSNIAVSGSNLASQAYDIAVSGSNMAWMLFSGSGAYIHDGNRTVKEHHIDFGTNADQVDASDIPYEPGGITYPTVAAALDALLYVPLQITSFTNDVGTVEIGTTVLGVNLTWAFNKDVLSQSIDQGIGALPVLQRTVNDSGAWTSNRTYSLSATDGTTPVNGNTTIIFSPKRYWGTSANTSLTDPQIISLNSEFSSSRSQTRNITAASEYIYFAYPASAGTATFYVNGLLNTAWNLTVISFTNASGFTSNYNLYRSTNLLTGTYQIIVS